VTWTPSRLKWTARCAATGYSDILRAQGWGDRRTLAGLTEGWINLYRILRPDIVVADYSPTANPVLQQRHRTACWVGGAQAVPVIYMRRELHRKWLDGDTPTNYAVATNAASFFRVEHTRLYRGLGDADYLGNLLDGFRSA
jgi:hypothetical protein